MNTEDLDKRHHPEISDKRRLMGMELRAAYCVMTGGALFVVIAGVGASMSRMFTGLIIGLVVFAGISLFARNFINNRPATYVQDWILSFKCRNYTPKKGR